MPPKLPGLPFGGRPEGSAGGGAAEFNLPAAQGSLLEIKKQMKETLEGQVAKANEADSQKVQISAHKTMIEGLAIELAKIKDTARALELGDALMALEPPASPPPMHDMPDDLPPHLIKGFISSRLILAAHVEACSYHELTQDVINKLLDKLQVGFVQPAVLKFLEGKKGQAHVTSHEMMIYVYRVMNLLYSRAIIDIMRMLFPEVGECPNYILLCNQLNRLCVLACESIFQNNKFSDSVVEWLVSLEFQDLVDALASTATTLIAVKTVDITFPTILPALQLLFSVGSEASGIVMTYSISVPLVTAVVVSNLVVNHKSYWAGVTGQISAVKGFAMSCVPANQLEQPGLAPAPVQAAAGGGGAVAQPACTEAVEHMSRLLDTPVVPRVYAFRNRTVLGEIERCVSKIVDITSGILQGAVSTLRTNPVVTVTRNTASFVQAFFTTFMSDARDKACVAKQRVEGTYEMKVAFLKLLLKELDENGFDMSVHVQIQGLIHVLSYQVRYLSKDMVALLIAYDVLANPDVMPFARLRPFADLNSQTVSGSEPREFVKRALQELELKFHTHPDSHDMVLDEREPHVPMNRGAQEFLPMFSDDELKLWGDLLVRKQRAGTAAPSGHTPFVSTETAQDIEERRFNPFYNFVKAIRADVQLRELERAPETMVQLKPLIEKFNQYVAGERQRLSAASAGGDAASAPLKDEVAAADSESKIAGEAVAIVAGCDDDAVSVGDGESEMEKGDDAAAASTGKKDLKRGPDDSGNSPPSKFSGAAAPVEQGASGGKSRRKNIKKTIRRYKGRKSSKNSKKTHQKRARRSSRKGRK